MTDRDKTYGTNNLSILRANTLQFQQQLANLALDNLVLWVAMTAMKNESWSQPTAQVRDQTDSTMIGRSRINCRVWVLIESKIYKKQRCKYNRCQGSLNGL